MINHAIRYRPVLRELERRQPPWVLEVGSGPEGLAHFWRRPVVGMDLAFKRRPLHRAVVASALALPIAARTCPAVVSCDLLEHIPPTRRRTAVSEMARVAAKVVLLGFPSGDPATQIYRELARKLGSGAPDWLKEHLRYGLPEASQVAEWLRLLGWQVQPIWYESAEVHRHLMAWESRLPVKVVTFSLMRLLGPWLAPRMPVSSGKPPLRVLLVAERAADREVKI